MISFCSLRLRHMRACIDVISRRRNPYGRGCTIIEMHETEASITTIQPQPQPNPATHYARMSDTFQFSNIYSPTAYICMRFAVPRLPRGLRFFTLAASAYEFYIPNIIFPILFASFGGGFILVRIQRNDKRRHNLFCFQ